jgi:large subunit ribosomal protein L6
MWAAKFWRLSGKKGGQKTMSRIGRKPIVIPAGVEVKLEGNHVTVKGPKGTLDSTIHPLMKLEMKDGEVVVSRPNDEKEARSLHGLSRTLVANMVQGVSEGFKKELEIQGIGYRAQKQGTNLVLNLGFSHPVTVAEKDGITIDVPEPTKIIVNGIDKQRVGQFAAEIREKRPPEPYKGKGIRYVGEFVIRKEGKAGKTG